MIRDLLLTGVILACLGLAVRNPFAGMLTWAWIALMQPHREAFGVITSTLRVNLTVAIVAIVLWAVSKERKLPTIDGTFVTMIAFMAWMTLTTFLAVDPDTAWFHWDQTWKIMALGLMLALSADNKVRIHALIWVIVICLLYYGTKGGLLSIMSGGAKRIDGPAATIIADNNQLALALLMILPLVNYLRLQSKNHYVRLGLLICGGLTFISVVSSYSRGAYLALGALALLGWVRSRNKLVYTIAIIAASAFVIYFMPPEFYSRLNSITNLDADESWQGRLEAWQVAMQTARDYFPFGTGFNGNQTDRVFLTYFPDSTNRAAHSIYFQVLGDHGYVGLGLYLVLLFLAVKNVQTVRRLVRKRPDLIWMRDLATMIQLSLLVFCIGGAALSMAYYDVTLIWMMLVPALLKLAQLKEPLQAKSTRKRMTVFAPSGQERLTDPETTSNT